MPFLLHFFYLKGGLKMQKLLSAREVADLFGDDVQTVYRLARNGILPFVKLGNRKIKFAPEQIEEFIRQGGYNKGA